MNKRTGTIYSEMTNKGRCSTKLVKGAKPIYCFNWVGEIQVNGKRYRKRSKNYGTIVFWIEKMLTVHGELVVRWSDKPVWTEERLQILTERYADTNTKELKKILGITERNIIKQECRMGLKKKRDG